MFSVKPGKNTITRRDDESSVTIPFERTFRNLDFNRPEGGDALEQFNFCGCGWPAHMLIPKGTVEGLKCHLFVMISNYADDKVIYNGGFILALLADYICCRSLKMYQDLVMTQPVIVDSKTNCIPIVDLWVIRLIDSPGREWTLYSNS